jgi:KipI family sensor histidine kinase inhibitor
VRFVPCGDAALAVHFDEPPSASLARRIAALRDMLGASAAPGVIESVPGVASLTVLFDPASISPDAIERELQRCAASDLAPATAPRRWKIPVCYEGAHAADLADVAAACGLSTSEVITAHTAREYVVYLLGFSPGFPYMGDVDPRLVLPRRANPRPRVPRGSVAIATTYTAIYPQSTAGGWHIIGATPVTLFDAAADTPAPLSPADIVIFEPVAIATFEALARDYAAGREIEPA